MATLQITISIDDEPLEGHQNNKLVRSFGETDGAILGRVVRANEQTFPRFKVDPVAVLVATIAEAVTAAETVVQAEA